MRSFDACQPPESLARAAFQACFLNANSNARRGVKSATSRSRDLNTCVAGSLEGSSDRPTKPHTNLSAEKGQSNSTPPPSFVVA
jgi:hypothetical protein